LDSASVAVGDDDVEHDQAGGDMQSGDVGGAGGGRDWRVAGLRVGAACEVSRQDADKDCGNGRWDASRAWVGASFCCSFGAYAGFRYWTPLCDGERDFEGAYFAGGGVEDSDAEE